MCTLRQFSGHAKAVPVSLAPSTGDCRNPSGQAVGGGKPEHKFLNNILPVVRAFRSHTQHLSCLGRDGSVWVAAVRSGNGRQAPWEAIPSAPS